MHYYALAIIPAEGDVDELVHETLAPYDEDLEIEQYEEDGETYWRNPVGLWDFYMIGGRYTGRLSGYSPWDDPALKETCKLCHGTGRRDDTLGQRLRAADPTYGCNGCHNTGQETTWPSTWPRHHGDVVDAQELSAQLADLPSEKLPFTIFAHGSETVTSREEWTGEDWVTRHNHSGIRSVLATILAARIRAGLKDRVVVIDYHS